MGPTLALIATDPYAQYSEEPWNPAGETVICNGTVAPMTESHSTRKNVITEQFFLYLAQICKKDNRAVRPDAMWFNTLIAVWTPWQPPSGEAG